MDAGAVAKLEEIDDRMLAVTTLASTEVATGIDPNTDAMHRVESVLDGVTIVPYGFSAARRTVNVQRGLRETGDPIGIVDVIIAGTAIARDDCVVTRNVAEFRRTPVRVSPF